MARDGFFEAFGLGTGGVPGDQPGAVRGDLLRTGNLSGLTPAGNGILGNAPKLGGFLGGHVPVWIRQDHGRSSLKSVVLSQDALYNICADLSRFCGLNNKQLQ